MPASKPKQKTKVTYSRKRRTREHNIADLSVNYVEKFALLNGFSVERIYSDYGYDLNVYTFNEKGEFENGSIFIQLKATDKLKSVNNNSEVSFSIDKKDINTWYNEPYPVIFILYDAKNEVGYWVYIQQYLKSLPNFDSHKMKNSLSIRISKSNIVDKDCFQLFRNFMQ